MLNFQEIVDSNTYLWRYQEKKHGGKIPVGHKSHERCVQELEPENVEQGVSCYSNPYQLCGYLLDGEVFDKVTLDRYNEEYEVVLFEGEIIDEGMDGEDIAEVEENCVKYTMSIRDFFTMLKEDLDWIYRGYDKNLLELSVYKSVYDVI